MSPKGQRSSNEARLGIKSENETKFHVYLLDNSSLIVLLLYKSLPFNLLISLGAYHTTYQPRATNDQPYQETTTVFRYLSISW